MSEWERCFEAESEEQEEVYSNEMYGTIVKVNGKYHALVPQTFVLGPFDDLFSAQRQVLLNYDVLLKLTQNFSPEMLKFIEDLRAGK